MIDLTVIPTQITISVPALQKFVNQLYRSDLICLVCSCLAFPNLHHEVAHFHMVFLLQVSIYICPSLDFIPKPTDFVADIYDSSTFLQILSIWCTLVWWILFALLLMP